MTTPESITTLKPDEVFVFGSNLAGNHAGGAAKQALQFGAVMGEYEGIQGQSYAFPTLDENFEKLSWDDLELSVYRLYEYAKQHPFLTFLLTKVGCGIAGYPEEEMKQLFTKKIHNVVYPEGW